MLIHALRRPEASGLPMSPGLTPWLERVAVPIEGPRRDRPQMLVAGFNPLAGEVPALPEEMPVGRVSVWSGWLPEDAEPVDGVFEPDFRTWGSAGWDAFSRAMGTLSEEAADRRVRVCVRPHARHVISDAQRCLNLLEAWPDAPIDLLPAPGLMLTDAMLSAAEEHLERILSALGGHERTVGLMLTGMERVVTGGGEAELRPCPLTRGELDGGRICEIAARHLSRDRPVILLEEDLQDQIALARVAGLQ